MPRKKKAVRAGSTLKSITQRVQVRSSYFGIWVLDVWVIVIIVQVLGKHMIIRYLALRAKFQNSPNCCDDRTIMRPENGLCRSLTFLFKCGLPCISC